MSCISSLKLLSFWCNTHIVTKNYLVIHYVFCNHGWETYSFKGHTKIIFLNLSNYDDWSPTQLDYESSSWYTASISSYFDWRTRGNIRIRIEINFDWMCKLGSASLCWCLHCREFPYPWTAMYGEIWLPAKLEGGT